MDWRSLSLRLSLLCSVGVLLATCALAQEDALASAKQAFERGEYREVIELARKASNDSADRAKLSYLAGEAQLVLGDAKGAEQSFREVLAVNEHAQPARVGLGRALTTLKRYDDAEKELRAATSADAKDAQAFRALGDCLVAADKVKDGKAALQQAAKLASNDPWITRSLVELALVEGDDKGALKLSKALAKARSKHPMGPFLTAIVLERDGKTDDAIEAYEQALALDERFLDAHKNLAILCHTMSATYSNAARVKKSLEHYERYFALGGKDPALEQAYRQMKSFIDGGGLGGR